uniref:Uncharacterized protein MANES_01G140200 n=1 Tax=Rhizophora mucronata TaxID=61149 RepID=A0A2P2J3N1_RHIMU
MLLLNEMSKLVNVRDSKQLGHKVVAKISRSNLHCLTSFPKLLYIIC